MGPRDPRAPRRPKHRALLWRNAAQKSSGLMWKNHAEALVTPTTTAHPSESGRRAAAEGEPVEREGDDPGQNRSAEITSPPAPVIRALKTVWSTRSLMNLTAPIGEGRVIAKGMEPAELGQRLVRVIGNILGLGPGDLVLGLDNQDRVRGPVEDLREFHPLLAVGEEGGGAGQHEVRREVRGDRLTVVGTSVEGGHLGDQLAVVRPVPGLVEPVLRIDVVRIQVGQEGRPRQL